MNVVRRNDDDMKNRSWYQNKFHEGFIQSALRLQLLKYVGGLNSLITFFAFFVITVYRFWSYNKKNFTYMYNRF